MLKDEFGYCVACFFAPCRCFGKESEPQCSQCNTSRQEIDALRDEVHRLLRVIETMSLEHEGRS